MKMLVLLGYQFNKKYLLVFTILLFAIFSCNSDNKKNINKSTVSYSTNSVEYPFVLKTKYGDVLVKERPKRMVSLTLTSDEILHELLDGNVYAMSYIATNKAFSKIYDRINTNTKIVRGDSEIVLSLNPDFLILASFVPSDIRETLKNNIESIYTLDDISRVEHLKKTIYDLGSIVDRRAKAVAMIEKIDNAVLSISNEANKNNYHPNVLLLTVNGYTAGKNTSFDEVARLAGAINISSDFNIIGHTEMPTEMLLKAQIDYVIASEYNMTEEEIIKFFKAHHIYKNIDAVKNDRILVLPHDKLVSTSQYFIDAVDLLYSKINEARIKEIEKTNEVIPAN